MLYFTHSVVIALMQAVNQPKQNIVVLGKRCFEIKWWHSYSYYRV